MKISPKRLLSLFTLMALSTAASALLLTHQPAIAKTPLSNLDQLENKQSTDPYYQQTREELESSMGRIGQDYYVVYRLVERIARANGLDEQPWRIRVSEELNVNAFASDLNMLTFEGGILEQLSGDRSALACVVGHEMAHHTNNHGPIRTEAAAKAEALQEEALLEARAEVESANRQGSIINSVIGSVSGVLGRSVGRNSPVGGIITGNVANQVLSGLNADQVNQATARAEEIYNERVEELSGEYSGELHRQELEADETGYKYMVAAGFEPSGCSRTMNVLNRLETSRLPSFSHPNPEDRLNDLAQLNTASTNQSLVGQGEANLSQSAKPLAIGIARDNGSLRVESRFGGQDIDAGFPE